jgi:hypothetical protein
VLIEVAPEPIAENFPKAVKLIAITPFTALLQRLFDQGASFANYPTPHAVPPEPAKRLESWAVSRPRQQDWLATLSLCTFALRIIFSLLAIKRRACETGLAAAYDHGKSSLSEIVFRPLWRSLLLQSSLEDPFPSMSRVSADLICIRCGVHLG